ncbi:NADH:flavin oxidoreductase [Idiomarina xiamenensis]|uniref:NADH:flavin oxidoreductase n=1 Tax=Idiomarina xiamenensis 10-D-4 TaxID=740709 RepID=K2JL80_9GAMM|nr:NADH:flavin oxidoreductase [Idiomarina xiamenensis]EKE84196.1 NADH:flavin oxidoreductase [Idiomarina xiamenensis 10-D-4]
MSQVYDDYSIGKHSLKNRLVVAPMTRTSAEADGSASELMGDYYERFAEGGFGLIITEGTYTDKEASQGYENQPGISDAPQTDAWKKIVSRVHEHDCKMILQLMHAGAQFQYNRFTDTPVSPSGVKPKGEPLGLYGEVEGGWPEPEEMNEHHFDIVMNGFIGAVNRAKEAGFDGVELHAANGYLLNEFLSDYFNRREDKWGGSLNKRLLFIEDVIKAAKSAAGDDFIVGIRISQITVTDPDYQWPEGEEGFEHIVSKLVAAGIDYIHTTDTAYDRKHLKDGDHSLAETVQHVSDVPLIINGGIDEDNLDDLAEQFPEALFAIGKKALANPDFAKRFKSGDEIADLDFAMLQPKATLENEWQWRKLQQQADS